MRVVLRLTILGATMMELYRKTIDAMPLNLI